MRIHKREAYVSERELLAGEPELDVVCQLCIEAYAQLSSERPIGMALGPIPYRAILAWAEFEQLDRDNTAMLIRVIMRLEHDRIERDASSRRLKEA